MAFSYRRKERLHEVGEVLRRLGRPKDPDPTELINADLVGELRALPPKQAAVIVLRFLHGFSNREIAFSLNVSERTIASRLAAAKARLRSRLGEQHRLELEQHRLELGSSQASLVPLEK